MKIGLSLHPERGLDAVFEEARQADVQGFDSIWLNDHLMNTQGERQGPDLPYDTLTLATAIGARTTHIRLAWAMLNVGFRPPTLLAKTLATLDQVTRGRVICSVGSGWFKEEYGAYNLPLIDDHDGRIDYAREVIQLLRELWTHPAPERVTFEGRYVQAHDLPLSPSPYQRPHPPIWFGGDSEASRALTWDLCDGWVIQQTDVATIKELRLRPDWPARLTTVAKTIAMFPQESRQAAEEEAIAAYEARRVRPAAGDARAFLATAVVGTPDDCQEQLAAIEAAGVNYVRANCIDTAHQARIAEHIIPRLAPAAVPA